MPFWVWRLWRPSIVPNECLGDLHLFRGGIPPLLLHWGGRRARNVLESWWTNSGITRTNVLHFLDVPILILIRLCLEMQMCFSPSRWIAADHTKKPQREELSALKFGCWAPSLGCQWRGSQSLTVTLRVMDFAPDLRCRTVSHSNECFEIFV